MYIHIHTHTYAHIYSPHHASNSPDTPVKSSEMTAPPELQPACRAGAAAECVWSGRNLCSNWNAWLIAACPVHAGVDLGYGNIKMNLELSTSYTDSQLAKFLQLFRDSTWTLKTSFLDRLKFLWRFFNLDFSSWYFPNKPSSRTWLNCKLHPFYTIGYWM